MKQIKPFNKVLVMTVNVVLLQVLTGCGTSYSVKQPLTATSLKSGAYVMGSCEIQDNRAGEDICNVLKEQVRYGLFKKGLYEKNVNEAQREVNLTITHFRYSGTWTRAWLGVLSGKDGLDVAIDVKDRQSGNIVGKATASFYNISAGDFTKEIMVDSVSKKIIEFLVSGKSK